jgi:hypothetical protein
MVCKLLHKAVRSLLIFKLILIKKRPYYRSQAYIYAKAKSLALVVEVVIVNYLIHF